MSDEMTIDCEEIIQFKLAKTNLLTEIGITQREILSIRQANTHLEEEKRSYVHEMYNVSYI